MQVLFARLLFILGIVTIVVGECEEQCINSDCKNNYCVCHPGYRQGGKFNCIPACSQCDYGECIRPNTCQCDNSTITCIGASCTQENTCECIEGFRFTPGNSTYCEPICTKACKNGKCSDDLKECICNFGYKLFDDGNCNRAKVKECPKNYTLNKYEECEPVCTKSCENGGGKCIKPNTCECEPKCIFGNCDEGLCDCDIGYHLRNNSLYECISSCETACTNGVCNAAGICKCNEGYTEINGECIQEQFEKTCARKCVNADCTGSNTCKCHLGFHFCWNNGTRCDSKYIQLEKLSYGDSCTPICTPSCINGNCIKSNICQCHDGYVKDLKSSNKCVPIEGTAIVRSGLPMCINCECTEPNNCKCFEGYRQLKERECIPKCDECGNGICIEPNVCQCQKSQLNCTNSLCTIDNKCKCFDGYIRSNDNICTEKRVPVELVCNSTDILNNGKCKTGKHDQSTSDESNIFIIIIIIISVLLCICGLIVLIHKLWLRRQTKVWRNPEIQYTAGDNSNRTQKPLLN